GTARAISRNRTGSGKGDFDEPASFKRCTDREGADDVACRRHGDLSYADGEGECDDEAHDGQPLAAEPAHREWRYGHLEARRPAAWEPAVEQPRLGGGFCPPAQLPPRRSGHQLQD